MTTDPGHRRLERLVLRLSTDMVNLVPERVDASVNDALAEIGTFAGVDRSYVFLFDKAGTHVTNTHEWCAPGIEPEIHRLQSLPVGDYPWLMRQLRSGEAVHVPRVGDLPEEARAEREEWQRESIRSILLVPMNASDRVAGYVGFDAVRAGKNWSREFIFLLRLLGEIVLNALTRKQAEVALREHRVLSFERSGDAILLSDSSNRFVHVNDAACELTGYSRDELLALTREDLVFADERSRVGPVLARVAAGQIVREEWRLRRKNGSMVLVEATARQLADGRVQAVIRDITERKRTLQAVAENRRMLLALMDNLPGMVYRCKPGPGWIPEFVSAGVLPLTGYRVEELIAPAAAVTPETMIHPQDLARVRHEIAQANAEARQYTVEYRLRTAAGDEKWVWERGAAVRGPAGDVVGIEGFITDLTSRKQAEQALAHSLAQLDAAQERAHLGSWERDPVTGAGFWSREMYRIFERDPALGPPEFEELLSMLNPAHRPEMLDLRARALQGAEAVSRDFRLDLANGAEKHVSATMQAVRDRAGGAVRLVGTMLDITSRKQAADELRRSETLKAAILAASLDGIITIDHEGKILEFNPAAEAIFGLTRQQALGKVMAELIVPPRLRDAHRRGFAHYLETGVGPVLGKRIEIEAIRADGTQFPIEIATIAIGATSKPMFTSFLRDVTDRKRTERILHEANAGLEHKVAKRTQELQQAKERAEAADRLKSEFLANMSHELRTPLNAIIGFTGTLLMKLPGALNAQQEEQLEIVQTSARHLLSLINDLLDLAKIESGKMQVRIEPVACGALLEEIAAMLRPLAAKKGVALEFRRPSKEVRVATDARALRQIVLNLCNNAIKFTEAGLVALELEVLQERRELEIGVTDTGVGIRVEDQQLLFQAFSQADSIHREGTGLGLHLSRKLAQLIRGQIHFKSEYGRGSRFWLRLPLE